MRAYVEAYMYVCDNYTHNLARFRQNLHTAVALTYGI